MRRNYTIVELFVALLVIGTLLGTILPAVSMATRAGASSLPPVHRTTAPEDSWQHSTDVAPAMSAVFATIALT